MLWEGLFASRMKARMKNRTLWGPTPHCLLGTREEAVAIDIQKDWR